MKKYKLEKMTNWYRPKMLLNIGLRAIVSDTFGNYADRREMQAALAFDKEENEREWSEMKKKYCDGQEEIWIDVICDTGDGFNSTFTIAELAAQKNIRLKVQQQLNMSSVTEDIEYHLPRGKVLIFGGDEIYPFPTLDAYTSKFRLPFEAAGEKVEKDKYSSGEDAEDGPDMYAIPGNHDWYDGLGNFIKLFCQRRRIGIWQTKQRRSYFVLPLPNNYWIWATDIQLNSDIDEPQLKYFLNIARNKMKEGDKIILITAEPAWVYKEIRKKDNSFSRLQFFINKFIYDKYKEVGKKFELTTTITGDLHHYSRYCDEKNLHGHQYITAGGGGAFLHLTHNLPQKLESLGLGKPTLQHTFPNKAESKKLLWGNLLFPLKNFGFVFLLTGVYFVYFWILASTGKPPVYFGISIQKIFILLKELVKSLSVVIATVGFFSGFYFFADLKIKEKWKAIIMGGLHGAFQLLFLLTTMFFCSCIFHVKSLCWPKEVIAVAAVCFAGAVWSNVIMGFYLLTSNLMLNMHINEASSSLISPDYKNFLRLKVDKEGLTIYPIGIKKVPRTWKQTPEGEGDATSPDNDDKLHEVFFTSDEAIQPFLVEPPIQIRNTDI